METAEFGSGQAGALAKGVELLQLGVAFCDSNAGLELHVYYDLEFA